MSTDCFIPILFYAPPSPKFFAFYPFWYKLWEVPDCDSWLLGSISMNPIAFLPRPGLFFYLKFSSVIRLFFNVSFIFSSFWSIIEFAYIWFILDRSRICGSIFLGEFYWLSNWAFPTYGIVLTPWKLILTGVSVSTSIWGLLPKEDPASISRFNCVYGFE